MLTFTRHTFIAGLLLGLALVLVGGSPSQAHVRYHPCAQEDSPGPCYWDAGHRGNGVGHSFWVGPRQRVHYGPLPLWVTR